MNQAFNPLKWDEIHLMLLMASTCDTSPWFIRDEVIGKGGNGIVFRACRTPKDCNYVAKVIPITDDFKYQDILDEIEHLKRFSGAGISQHYQAGYECFPFHRLGKGMFQNKNFPLHLHQFLNQ